LPKIILSGQDLGEGCQDFVLTGTIEESDGYR
jgi:hypothetical protein